MTAAISSTHSPIELPPLRQWHSATWDDYVALRNAPLRDRVRLFFNCDKLWIDMGGEGINHAAVSDLFTMLFAFWSLHKPEQQFSSMGRCLLEKPQTQACAPHLVLYVGEHYPQWQEGQPHRIDLAQWRVPDLVGEISDTTLVNDLDEQKHLYAALDIPEYWVVDVQGQRVFAFQLENGKYRVCQHSQTLEGLPIALLEETIKRLARGTNTSAAAWFAQQISSLTA